MIVEFTIVCTFGRFMDNRFIDNNNKHFDVRIFYFYFLFFYVTLARLNKSFRYEVV